MNYFQVVKANFLEFYQFKSDFYIYIQLFLELLYSLLMQLIYSYPYHLNDQCHIEHFDHLEFQMVSLLQIIFICSNIRLLYLILSLVFLPLKSLHMLLSFLFRYRMKPTFEIYLLNNHKDLMVYSSTVHLQNCSLVFISESRDRITSYFLMYYFI
jgi:hypothetical protein